EAVTSAGRLLIVGESGAGKTIIVQEMCRRHLWDAVPKHQIPVFVSFSNAHRITNTFEIVVQLVAASVVSKFQLYRHLLARRLITRGNLLIIFDGLDYLRLDEHKQIVELSSVESKCTACGRIKMY